LEKDMDSRAASNIVQKAKGPAILAMLIGLGGMGYAYMQDPKAAIYSYFFAFVCWMCLTLGCFALTVLHHTVRGKWGLAILRLVESGGSALTFIIMAILFIPIAMHMKDIYSWLNPQLLEHDAIIQYKSRFLNQNWFLIRTVIYFVVWIGIAYYLRQSSIKEDQTRDINERAKRTNLAAPGLLLLVVTINFAFTDWVMSIDPHWYSTIYGIWFLVGQGIMALALGVHIFTKNRSLTPYSEVINPKLTRDLGNMLLALTMVWGYFTLSQFLIIWSGNIPEYTSYYALRFDGAWVYVGAAIVVGQFAIPFLCLLAPRTKAVPKLLMILTAWIFLMRFADLYWNVMPMLRKTAPQWTDLAALLGIGGIWSLVFQSQLLKADVLPKHDNRLMEVAH
jgi:hypothetical protein